VRYDAEKAEIKARRKLAIDWRAENQRLQDILERLITAHAHHSLWIKAIEAEAENFTDSNLDEELSSMFEEFAEGLYDFRSFSSRP